MRKLIACLLLLGAPFLMHAQYVTNGTAVHLGGNEYRLTEAITNQGGSVWYQVRLDLRYDFIINAEVNLGNIDGGGADGIAFVLQPLSVNQGGHGGGIGYQGIAPSLAIEFDTWQNTEWGDPAQDHIAFMRNGSTQHDYTPGSISAPNLVPNLEDGVWSPAQFIWHAASHMLTLNYRGQTYSIMENITNTIFMGSPYVYWGFTGATGAAINDQRVRIGAVSFVEEMGITGVVTNTSCPASEDGAIDITVTGGVPPYSYAWSNMSTAQDQSDLAPGTYVVTVTDAAGVSKSESFTVGSNADNTGPSLGCPPSQVNACFNSTGNYSIPALSASDACGIASTEYGITGATVRNGSGNDASGAFNPGNSTITWTVTDNNGNTSTCTVQVSINNPLTASIADVYAVNPGGAPNTIYIGYGPSSLTLTAVPSGGSGSYSFNWSTGETTPSITVSPSTPGTHTYTVVVTDEAGCSVTVTKEIEVVDVRCGNKMDKVMVCHVPPGNPANAHVICISRNAVATHLSQHGDMLGNCQNRANITRAGKTFEAVAEEGVYPNPTSGRFNIQLSAVLKGRAQLLILNANGSVVEKRSLLLNSQNLSLDLSGKPAGVYLVQVSTSEGVQTEKITVRY